MRLLPLAALLLAGCPSTDTSGDDTDTADTEPADTVVDSDTDVDRFAPVQALFDRSCATSGCHAAPGEPTTGLDLSAGAAYDHLVGVDSAEQPELKRVAPGDLDGSWLWHKVDGSTTDVDPTDQTDAMPPPFGLGEQDLAIVRAWIEAGAPDSP
jgi:hypothetical protein